MRIAKTEALVLRRTDYSDTSQIIDLFTRERGRMSVMARGARQYRRRAHRLIDVLYRGTAIILEKPTRDVQILSDFETSDHHPGLRRHLDRYHAGLHLVHLLRRVTRPEATDRRLYGLAIRALARFETVPLERLAAEVAAFDVRFLAVIGFALTITGCPRCGLRHAPGAATYFAPLAGGCACDACQRAQPATAVAFSPGGRKLLHDITHLHGTARDAVPLPASCMREVRKILNLALTSLLEAELPMLKYLPPP